jgi:hypothetical protein
MTWIRFDRDEMPAPSLELFTPDGKSISIADFRGKSNLVVFFAHGWECATCRRTIESFSAARQHIDARLLVVLADGRQLPPSSLPGVTFLVDSGDELRKRFTGLLEFELPGERMLFVLNSFTSPVRAWVGKEAAETDLIDHTSAALDYINIQCPE